MTTYGYRLFKLELCENSGNTSRPFEVEANADKGIVERSFPDHLQDMLATNTGVKQRGLPRRAVDEAQEESAQEDPVFRLVGMDRVDRGNIAVVVEDGQNRGWDKAMAFDPDGSDLELGNHAPYRAYRGVVVMPSTGKSGVLALECIDKHCPVTPLVRWSKWWSQRISVEADDGRSYWRLRANVLTDDQQLRDLLREGRLEEVVLRKLETATTTRGRRPESLRLSASLRDGSRTSLVRELLLGWAARASSTEEGARQTNTEGAGQLSALIGPDVEKLDFNDGYVRVSGTGGNKNISPERMSEVFTYVLGNDLPSDRQLYDAMKVRLLALSVQENMGLDLSLWP